MRVLRRRLGIILLATLLVPAGALAYSLLQEKKYTATASLLFRDPGFDQKLFGSSVFTPSTDPAREAATNVKLVSLDTVFDRTERALGGSLARDGTAGEVEVAAEGQSNVASVKATHPNRRFSARLANTFARQYVRFRVEADRSKIQDALRLVERQIERLTPGERNGSSGRSLRDRADRLAALASLQTGNAELVQPASTPTDPSSPRPLRNAIIGLLLGLLLGIGLAFLLEWIDRRIREPREVEEMFGRPILTTIPQSRALSEPTRKAKPALAEAEAFRMLRANLRYFNINKNITSVVITSAGPGDGKSTVAQNLAAAGAETGSRTLLIEADLRHPSLGHTLGVNGKSGMSQVLAGQTPLRDAIQKVRLGYNGDGARSGTTIDVLLSGPLPPNPTDLIESDRMRELISQAESDYELVVIDTPPTAVVSDAIPLLTHVDGVIVVSRLGKSTRDSVTVLRDQLENMNAPVLGVVVNSIRGVFGYGYGYGYGYGAPEERSEGDVAEPDGDDEIRIRRGTDPDGSRTEAEVSGWIPSDAGADEPDRPRRRSFASRLTPRGRAKH